MRTTAAQRRAVLNYFAKKYPKHRNLITKHMVKHMRGWTLNAVKTACGLPTNS